MLFRSVNKQETFQSNSSSNFIEKEDEERKAKSAKHISRRCRQRFNRRTKKAWEFIDTKESKKIAQQLHQCDRNINNSLINTFGFIVDTSKSATANAVAQLGDMPTWLYFSRPLNMAFHNLTTKPTDVPAGIRSLLGLGLNFCPTPTATQKNANEALARFSRDASTKF